VRVDKAIGRLKELRQRQRRSQAEAARPLLMRDGDGPPERLFGAGLARSRLSSRSDVFV
jgi:hypothetical protein